VSTIIKIYFLIKCRISYFFDFLVCGEDVRWRLRWQLLLMELATLSFPREAYALWPWLLALLAKGTLVVVIVVVIVVISVVDIVIVVIIVAPALIFLCH